MKCLHTPLKASEIAHLRCGEEVLLSGTLYSARDQAHRRLIDSLKKRRKIPFNLKEAAVYYVGPAPPRKGEVIGACGPTTSGRMDSFTPYLMSKGLRVMIGKGRRNPEVVKAIKKYKGVYFSTLGGCGALLREKVTDSRLIAYKDLGPEAVYKITVEDFPLIVACDSKGRNIFRVSNQ